MAPTIYLIEVAREDVLYRRTWSDPEGEQGVWTLLINHKAFGFLSNTGPDPLKKSETYQASIRFKSISGPPAICNRHLNGVSLAGR